MRRKLIILGLVVGLVGFGKGAAFADTESWPFTTAGNYTLSDEETVEVADGVAKFTTTYNNIGTPGAQGFGVGACPSGTLPSNFTALSGAADKTSANYGNYQFQDNSIMVYIPKFYYKIGTGSNGLAVNVIDVKSIYDYTSRTDAEAAGYALHRAFIDGGAVKDGFFFDKYMCSQNSYGGEEIASSIKNGLPISTASAHNPIANLTACSSNNYYQAINAAHGRGTTFHTASRFQYSALAILSMAHGQASSSTDYCAWYHATYNFPKGCNNNALSDTNDTTVIWESDGYSNCGKTGSAGFGGGAGNVFAKSTHNGQDCGVADLNGLMWEVTLGVTCISSSVGIEGMSSANPCVVTWTGHGLSTGNYVRIDSITQASWTALNGKIYKITVIGAGSFSLDGVDSSAWAAYDPVADPGTITKGTFYLAKEATAMKNFTSGNSGATDHWGATGVAAMMDSFSPAFETGYANNSYSQRYGSGSNQVLAEDISGNNWLLSGLGFPKDADGIDTSGTNLFGTDYFYQYIRNELCLISCASWYSTSSAGVWYVSWYNSRTRSNYYVGFRAACYPE